MDSQNAVVNNAANNSTGGSNSFGAYGIMAFNGGDLFAGMNETAGLADVINQDLIFAVTLMTNLIANLRESLTADQKAALQPVIDKINAISQQTDIEGSDGYKLQALTTQYNDLSTQWQQTQTTVGGYQDGVTQTMSTLTSAIENFIQFLGKLVSILQQTSSLTGS
jgi:hypothetical protein